MTEKEKIDAWMIDDTGFLKQGKHPVGVQRQYTASAGKVTNCQIGVSLTLSTREDHVPVDFELYLPKSWTTDRERREATRIPSDVSFATRPELGLQLIRRAIESGLPHGTVLADAAHGGSKQFGAELRQLGLDYAVAVNSTPNMQVPDRKSAVRDHPCQLKILARSMKNRGAFRRCTWRQGPRRAMTAQFARVRVQVGEEEQATLLIGWRDNEHEPGNYFFISMAEFLPSNHRRISTFCSW
jgi:SRSO17 transposase